MHRILARLLSVIVLAAPLLVAHPSVASADSCQFAYGFKVLHDMIPGVVGDCIENEHYDPNGDGLQMTRKGLLVWHKADNSMAFTDGYHTWVYGPYGLQQRLNQQRFAWESDAANYQIVSDGSHLASCQFAYGFKQLHGLIPGVVGDCTQDQHYNPKGDGLQMTRNGLLVWRKADNSMAFTNGYYTWVYGPYGLQQRLNQQRFAWESDAAGHAIAPAGNRYGVTAGGRP